MADAEFNLKALVEKYDFADCSQDEYLETFDRLCKASSEHHTKDDIIAACQAFQAQMNKDNFPDDNQYGVFMGNKTVYYIMDAVEYVDLQTTFKCFALKWISNLNYRQLLVYNDIM